MSEDLNPPSESTTPDPGAFPPFPKLSNEDSSLYEDELETEDAEPPGWKDALRHDFEEWLDSVEKVPEPDEDGQESSETPDLYSFYEQLAAAGAESRKANRRTAEAFGQWGEVLTRFESELKPLRESVLELKTGVVREKRLSSPHALVVIELADRLRRMADAFEKTPKKSWFCNDQEWRAAWENQRQGLRILMSHLEDWLEKEGVERFDSLGQPFDPSLMSAVSAEQDSSRPHQTVLEEITPGYRRQGELLRSAQVKVSLNKTQP